MPDKLQPEKWYLLRIKSANKPDQKKVYVLFESMEIATYGAPLPDTFYLTEKAITRFETLAHRAGYEGDVKTPEQVDVKVINAILGKRVWVRIKADERDAKVLRTDGWNFRPETDPPEEESAVDYKKRDEWEAAMDGI